MDRNYLVEPGGVIRKAELIEWAHWYEASAGRLFENGGRRVDETLLPGDVRVSTVFLGLDHNFGRYGLPPVLFETMIFGGPHNDYQERYVTVEEARAGHAAAVTLARADRADVQPASPANGE